MSLLHRLDTNNDYHTPDYCMDYILPFIKKVKETSAKENFTVWEPACSKQKMIVKYLKRHKIKTVGTCISKGRKYDFMTFEPPFEFDMIITNPPFSMKKEFIDKCLEYDKPFILIIPLRILENTSWYSILKEKDFSLLIPMKRIHYIKPCGTKSKSAFQSGFLCYGLALPQKLMFVESAAASTA